MYVSKQKPNRSFLCPLDIVIAAKREGIGMEQLQEMVRCSTRITHPLGNRRFRGYLFMVEGNKILAFGRLQDVAITEPEEAKKETVHHSISSVDDELGGHQCHHCKGSGRVSVFNQCEACNGAGCNRCDEGLVPSSIPCPMCEAGKLATSKRA